MSPGCHSGSMEWQSIPSRPCGRLSLPHESISLLGDERSVRIGTTPSWVQNLWDGSNAIQVGNGIGRHPSNETAFRRSGATKFRRTAPLDCPPEVRRHVNDSASASTRFFTYAEIVPRPIRAGVWPGYKGRRFACGRPPFFFNRTASLAWISGRSCKQSRHCTNGSE